MRLRLAIALAVVATCASTGSVVAGPEPVKASTAARVPEAGRFWGRLLAESPERRDVAGAWVAAARAVAQAGGPFAQVEASGKPSNGRVNRYSVFRDFGFAGDLDGDRRSDVVEIAQRVRWYDSGTISDRYDVAAYESRSGRRLWTTRVTPPEVSCVYDGCSFLYRFGYAFPTSLASGAGVEVAVFSVINDSPKVTFDPNDPRTWSYGGLVFAIDFATVDHLGRQVWKRHIEGRLDVEGRVVTLDDVPILHGTGRTESGKVDDWLFTVSDGRIVDNGITRANLANTLRPIGLSPYIPNGDLFSSQAVVVDGRTGKLRNIGDAVFGPAAVRDLTPVGDMSGDGRDDLVETHPYVYDNVYTNRNSDGNGIVAAIRSSDGSQLWQQLVTAGKPSRVSAAGDLNGDKRADAVIELLPASEGATPDVVAVDGATGSLMWQKQADSVLRLGDIRRNGRANVLLATIDTASKKAVQAGAYDAAGSRLWTATVNVLGTGGANAVAAFVYDAGDLDADGFSDIDVSVVTVTTSSSGGTTTTRVSVVGIGFVSARTGKLLPRVSNERAIYGSLDGNGDDATTSYATGVTVRSGHTAKPLWQVDFGRRVLSAWAGTDGTRGRCGNLLTSAYFESSGSDDTVVVGMFDRSGGLLWTKTFGKPVSARPRTVSKSYRC